MTPEQRAALERLKAKANRVATDKSWHYWEGEGSIEAAEVAKDWLSQHRADDQHLTPESLRTIGVQVGRWYDAAQHCGVNARARVVEDHNNLLLTYQQLRREGVTFQEAERGDDDWDAILIHLTSLSQARSLLAGLGVVS